MIFLIVALKYNFKFSTIVKQYNKCASFILLHYNEINKNWLVQVVIIRIIIIESKNTVTQLFSIKNIFMFNYGT